LGALREEKPPQNETFKLLNIKVETHNVKRGLVHNQKKLGVLQEEVPPK